MNRRTLALLLGAMVVGACGGAPAPIASHSSPSAAPATATPAGPISCRLPVAGLAISPTKAQLETGATVGDQRGTGGFLDLPSGHFTPDQSSDTSYVAASRVWLPVSQQAVSPDQRSYIESRAPQVSAAPPTTTLYLVQVATGASRLLFTAPAGQMAVVLAFTSKGIYVETVSSTGPSTAAQLLVIDAATGLHHAVAGAETPSTVIYSVYTAISGEYAWGTRITGSQEQPLYQLVRLDLTRGTVVVWNHSATMPYFATGFDGAGHPIVNGMLIPPAGGQADLRLLSAPDQSTPISITGGTFLQGRGNAVNDTHGTWFGSADGSIWLYSAAKGLEKMANVPPQAGGTGDPYDQHAWRSVAGPCT